jgi:hypothetical protein
MPAFGEQIYFISTHDFSAPKPKEDDLGSQQSTYIAEDPNSLDEAIL